MARILSALVGICILAFAQARPVYICEVLFENFCPNDASTCANDPVLHFSGVPYGLEHFNLVSFGGGYAPSGDVEGRAAFRNSVTLTSYSIGYQLRTEGVSANSIPLPYTMVVGGDANWRGGSVHPDGSGVPYLGPKEYIFVGSDFTNADDYLKVDRTGSCNGNAGCLNADFDAAQAYYKDLSAAFASLPDNAHASIESWGTITLTCDNFNDAQYVLTLTPNQFSSLTFWDPAPTCNPNSGLIVNIIGAGNQVTFKGNTQALFANAKTLYNVVPTANTPSVRVEVGVNGNLLAPSSVYNQPGMGVFIGQVIVADVTQVHQINLIYCAPPPPNNNHNNSNNYLCPAWETDCAGLDLTLDDAVYSFRDMNAISFGDFVADTGDIQGRLAVQGSATFGNGYTVGDQLQTSVGTPDRHLPYSLIVGHDLYWGSGELFPVGNGIPFPGLQENMFVGGSYSGSEILRPRVTGSCGESSGCLETTFNNAKACYTGYSNNIASVADNVAKVVEFSGLSITCNDASASDYYVSLTSSDFSSSTYTTLGNCNFQANWFINVVGTDDVTISGDSWPGVPGGIVYNIVGCDRTITVRDTTLAGHFLGPCATLNQPEGLITGKVVAGDVVASRQINRADTCPQNFTVEIPVVVQVPSITASLVRFAPGVVVPGDVLTPGDYEVIETFADGSAHIDASISTVAGQKFIITVDTVSSRTPENSPNASGASAVSIAVALVVALIALAF